MARVVTGIPMLTEFLKPNVRHFVDIEASEGGSGDGETIYSNSDGTLPRQKFILMLTFYE